MENNLIKNKNTTVPETPIDKFIYWVIAALVFLLPLLTSRYTSEVFGLVKMVFTQYAVLILAILWLIKINLQKRLDLIKSPFYLPIIAFLLINILSLTRALNIHEALIDLGQLFTYVILFFIAINNLKEERLFKLANIFILAGFLVSAYDFFTNRGINFNSPREAHLSTLGHPAFAAEYIMMVMPFAFVALWEKKNNLFKKIIFFSALLCMFVFLALTKTRASWLGMICSFLAMGYCLLESWQKKLFFTSLMAMAAVALIFAGFAISPQKESGKNTSLVKRFYSIFNPEDYSNKVRLLIWKNTLKIIKDYPLMGVGIGNFRVIYPKYRNEEEFAFTGQEIRHDKAHNEFLQIFAETGIVGLACFLWLLSVFFRSLFRVSQRETPQARLFVTATGGAILAALIQALFTYNFHTPVAALHLWLFLSFAAILESNLTQGSGVTMPIQNTISRVILFASLFIIVFSSSLLITKPLIADVYLEQALKAQNAQSPAEALLPILNKAIEFAPYDLRAQFIRANVLRKLGRYPESEAGYKEALKLFPYYSFIYNNLGRTYFDARNLELAKEAYLKALKIDLGYISARKNLILIYLKLGEKESAAGHLERLLTQALPKKMRDEATQLLLSFSLDDADTHYHRARTYANQGRFREALAEVEIALSKRKEYREALKLKQRIIEKMPK